MFWNVFDGVLLTSLGLCIVLWPTQLISDSQYRWLRIVAVTLAVVQLVVDDPRIQLLPAYLVAALFFLLLIAGSGMDGEPSAVRESKEPRSKKLTRWTMIVGSGFALLISITYCLFFPRQ